MNASEIRATLSLGGVFALRMLGLFMIVPVFAIYGQQYNGATPILIGLAIGAYGLTQAILQIPVSMLADRIPRKPIIIIGLLLFALGGAVAAMADSIWQVVMGRAIAGAGAISAVVMALLADVTREQTRSRAMAMMGFIIAFSIFIAFMLGPLLVAAIGISGLFWLTSLAGLAGIGLVIVSPTAKRLVRHHLSSPKRQFLNAFSSGNMNCLYVTVFVLHLLMTALFVIIPAHLIEVLALPIAQHGWVYFPLLILGFLLAVPLIIVAEKKRRMAKIVRFAAMLLALSLAVLAFLDRQPAGVWLGLGIFFVGFNMLEAIIPSWLSKEADVTEKATVMGVSASSQFLGAFCGGLLGGLLLNFSVLTAATVLGLIALTVVVALLFIGEPPYLSSLTVKVPDGDHQQWLLQVQAISGVGDVVVLPDHAIAYLKVDKAMLSDAARSNLSRLTGQALDF